MDSKLKVVDAIQVRNYLHSYLRLETFDDLIFHPVYRAAEEIRRRVVELCATAFQDTGITCEVTVTPLPISCEVPLWKITVKVEVVAKRGDETLTSLIMSVAQEASANSVAKVPAKELKVGDEIVIDIGYREQHKDVLVKIVNVYETPSLFGGTKINIDWEYERETGTTDGSPDTLFEVVR